MFGKVLNGEVVLLTGRFGLTPSGSDEFGYTAAHFRELLGEGPIPAGPCNKLRQLLTGWAIQDRDPLDHGVDAETTAGDVLPSDKTPRVWNGGFRVV